MTSIVGEGAFVRKLRIGLLLNSYQMPAWVYRYLEQIAGSDYAEIAAVIINGSHAGKKSLKEEIFAHRRTIVYNLFDHLDRRLFPSVNNAFSEMDATELLRHAAELRVMPIAKRFTDTFPDSDVEAIKSLELDVLIRVGFRILKGGILGAARYGVWSYHHGNNRVNRGAPPGFWEVVHDVPETGSMLQILNEEIDGGQVLCRSWSLTYRLSPSRNRNYYFWTSSSFIPRQLKRLHDLGPERFFAGLEQTGQSLIAYDRKLFRTPTNHECIRIGGKLLGRIAGKFLRQAVYRDQWRLMYDFNDSLSTIMRRFKPIIPPRDRFWADPHIVQRGDRYYIFIEELIYQKKIAHISVMEMDGKGNWQQPVTILEQPYHLSYPFVFEWEGTWYMVPESLTNRTIQLYEAVDFPYRWRHKMNLMDGVIAADATLVFKDGIWWLFAAMVENPGASIHTELFLFYSESLVTTDWQPHPLNPIVSDAKNARPAGRILDMNGRLYRPAQNCTRSYGYGFNLNEITVLTATDYQERIVSSVGPHWQRGMSGTHTISHAGRLTVVDVLMSRNRLI